MHKVDVSLHAIKNEEKIETLKTFDSSFFLIKIIWVVMVLKICLFIKQQLVARVKRRQVHKLCC